MNEKLTFAVIVTYNHDNDILDKLLNCLYQEKIHIVIVKNSKQKITFNNTIFSVIENDDNYGLAYALNQGISLCVNQNPKLIILFDQDSYINNDDINILTCRAKEIFQYNKVAAIGPSFTELNTNRSHGFANYKGIGIVDRKTNNKVSDALYLITSGTVLNPLCLEEVGLMNEKLFIDYIDIEWGLRAKSKGYSIKGFQDVKLMHQVGDRKISCLFYNVPLHSSIRLYYQTRNSVYLYKKKYMPLRWKVADIIYFFKRSLLYLYVDFKNYKIILKGIVDGIMLNG